MSDEKLNSFLLKQGFVQIEADIWANFITSSVAALRAAAEQLRAPDRWNSFLKKEGALSTAKKKKKEPNGPSYTNPLEDGITAELGHCLKRISKRALESDLLKILRIQFETQYQIELPNKTGRSSRKADIAAYSALSATAPELIFEAKVLVRETDIVDSYLANEGIGCFNSLTEPYSRGPVGAMIGYIVNGDQDLWIGRVQRALHGPPQRAPAYHYVSIEGENSGTLCSELERTALDPKNMLIFHFAMFFDMSATLPQKIT